MSYEVLEGQARKFRQGGTFASSATVTCPEGQFLARTGDGDVYDVITTTSPNVVYLNLVDTDRADVIAGGVAVLAGPFELKTTVYDTTATFVLDEAVTVKKVGDSVSGLVTMAVSLDVIHGWVLQVPSASNGNVLRVRMSATNDGIKS